MEQLVEFSQRISDLANRSKHAASYAQTEEATKTAVVLPFIQMLGFDPFNLEEVIPEFIADVGIKKGEKIDFALRIDNKIAILMGLCCTNPVRDSSGESSVVAGGHEQTHPPRLQDQELAGL